MIHFHADLDLIIAEAGDDNRPARIAGIAVPWDVVATVSGGQRVKFLRGAFDLNQKPAKLLENHDMSQLRGVVNALSDSDAGLEFEATLADTRASKDVVALLKAGAYDSVSVGANPVSFKFDKQGVMVVSNAQLIEVSLVAVPAYAEAVITEIAASADPEESEEEETLDTPEEETVSEAIKAESEESATTPTSPILYAQTKREFKLPSAAEYMCKFVAGGAEFAEFNSRIHAAAPDVQTTDLPGILPTPIISPIYNNFVANYRPLITAMGVRQMPQSGKVFIRPKVVTNTTIGASNGELVALDQGTFVVDDIQITKALYGGYVKLSEESIDMTSPEVLSALVDDMARVYANATDVAACATFEAGVSQTETLTSATTPADWVSFIYNSAEQILTNSNGNLPNVLIMAPAYYAALGALVDGQGRPLFPNVGPQNALGTTEASSFNGNAFGLNLVVDRNLTLAGDNNLYVGDSSGFECWEQQRGAVSVDLSDGALGRVIKFRGYFSSVMMDATKFVKRG
jgi:HK97 family phage prohead protease